MAYKIEYLIVLREKLGMNADEFAIKLGYTNEQSYKNIEAGQSPISSVLIKRLENIGLNSDFLERGEGTIFLNGSGESPVPNINIHSENIKSAYNEKHVKSRIPYYEIPATMSPIAVYSDDKEIPVYYIEMPALKDCDFALPAWGDSMYPKIKNGQIIAVKELKDKSQVQWGEIYLVITDEIRAVKYVRRHNNESKVILASENRDHFDDMVIEKKKILNLFIVKGQINILVN